MDWLLRTLPAVVIVLTIVSALTLAEIAINNRNALRGRFHFDVLTGRTTTSGGIRILAFASITFGGIIAWAGIVNFMKPGQLLPFTVLVTTFGGGGTGLWMLSLHRWEWDEAGIRWLGVLRSRQFAWADIVKVGRFWDYYFVEAHTGERIWWSQRTIAYTVIEDAVRTARPDLCGLFHKPRARSSVARD
jgi:hypothetical protein